MTSEKKPLRNPKDYINVTVLRVNHEMIKSFLDKFGDGRDIGKFYCSAGVEKMQKENKKNGNKK